MSTSCERDFAVERFEVLHEQKPLLYQADGTPLKRQIGFGQGEQEKMSQVRGTNPDLYTKKPKGSKKAPKK